MKQWNCTNCGKLELVTKSKRNRVPVIKLCFECLCKKHNSTGECHVCGNQLKRQQIVALGQSQRQKEGRNGARFCSKACMFKGHSGKSHHSWSGGRYVDNGGYIKIRVDGAYVLEHRFVMEGMVGRKLLDTETVHHIDGDRKNNKPENLELWTGRHGRHQRLCDIVNCISSKIVHYNPTCIVVTDDIVQHSRLVTVVDTKTGSTVLVPI